MGWNKYPLTDLCIAFPKFCKLEAIDEKKPPPCFESLEAISKNPGDTFFPQLSINFRKMIAEMNQNSDVCERQNVVVRARSYNYIRSHLCNYLNVRT